MTERDSAAPAQVTPPVVPAPRPPSLPRPPLAATPLLVAAGLALAAHGLTVGTGGRFGLNVTLWVGLFVGAALTLAGRKGAVVSREGATLLALALAFALTFALWDLPPLFLLINVLALLLALVLGAAGLRFPGMGTASVGRLIGVASTGGLRFGYGPLALLERFPWARLKVREGRGAGRAGVGLLLTAPVLLVFGGLLAGADAGFARLASHLFDWRLDGFAETVFKLLGWGTFAGGLVYPALMALRPTLFPAQTQASWQRLGLIEVGVPLGSLGVLFVVFLGTQLPYFLSGTSLPEGLTFADYVRRGFTELLNVALLTLALLLGAHGVTREAERTRSGYRALNLAVLGPLALILLSAANRWRLYTLAYGLSEIRVLGAAFLIWLVLALGWLAWGLWRGDLQRFAYPALVAGFTVLLATTALSPGAVIARVNVNRQTAAVTNDLRRTPQQANVDELLRLGADAVPVVLGHLETLTRGCGFAEHCGNDRETVLRRLEDAYRGARDLRVWNASYARARTMTRTLSR
ncbi:DUF4153 domain-containing protein [Deinococcus hopiensis]|uniref:Uncharacterized protein n=1 Tax=Deinococcus hopiensis KR-140 TaxID=695939 RepID=A0A1W1VSH6_9DEIO|nr:DUF4173 domain-containing protein [Deinococcus hopiensis]SMB96051.1 protein of unknown function [Deinococcus hopiensis KR-140]